MQIITGYNEFCKIYIAGVIFETTYRKVKVITIFRVFIQQDPIVPVMTSLAREEVSNPLLGKTHR